MDRKPEKGGGVGAGTGTGAGAGSRTRPESPVGTARGLGSVSCGVRTPLVTSSAAGADAERPGEESEA
jgi:hypothetical protein